MGFWVVKFNKNTLTKIFLKKDIMKSIIKTVDTISAILNSWETKSRSNPNILIN